MDKKDIKHDVGIWFIVVGILIEMINTFVKGEVNMHPVLNPSIFTIVAIISFLIGVFIWCVKYETLVRWGVLKEV